MEPTYTILGTDGQQYGPATADQLRGWVREGRVGSDTQVWRSDQPAWVTAAALPELGVVSMTTAAPTPIQTPAAPDPELEKRMKSGAGWFYWIAGFSIVNSILIHTGQEWGFALGLGISAILDGMAAGVGGAASAIAIGLNILACGIVILFGYFAGKGHGWAFITGMILLGLDTALTGILQMWLSLGLHLFALFCIFAGYKASRELRG